ncbi:probable disease resistance RPP8-like protein 4 [Prunus avium]|uniref:Probable disease resistance RPP8-like protein 4 n=1 Tax=Prunus avium TaxID=42229 RepID=A0A6P5RHC3_PRUAV|nr:probable disease resistance RPP8-like protein 4 [Prunus avium]
MAEFAVSTVVEKLTSWITEEKLLLEGVGDKVEQLRDQLRWMQSFLKDVDAKREKNERLRNWVSQIREVALDAEDIVETYITEAASHSSWDIPAKLINLHQAGKKIGKIQSRVQNISSQKEHFGITGTAQEGREGTSASPNERLRWWRQTSPNIEEDDLVDLVEDTKALLTQLSSMDPRRRVVSIVGMGGLGKTTLAKKLYNHCDLKYKFDCKAFVYVSNDYSRRDTLQEIIATTSPDCNMEDLKKLAEEALVLKLHKLLKDRRYLVVLDDIWEKEVWDNRVSAVLALSYNDLPFHLKSCFLYLGLFPEDSSISKTKLIRLWVAEGFLPQQGEEAAEGVAENCLNELVDRCMIQVGTLTSLGSLKAVRMHDVLRDFSISKGREESFLEIYSGQEIESPTSQRTKCRRLAIHGEHDNLYVFLKPYAPYLRSLLFFNMGDSKLDFVFKDFKLLRVLDGVPFSSPSAIGNLIQLRYLGLGVLMKTYMVTNDLPRSIGKMKNLQTLEVTNFINLCFPNVIWKLKNLRHLVVVGVVAIMNSRLDLLNNLRTIEWVKGGRWIEDGRLASLTNLRRLIIVLLAQEELNSLVSNIERLHCLESLSLYFNMPYSTLPTDISLSHLEHLHKLHLNGNIKKLPDPHQFPPNLVKLSLSNSVLEEDSIDKLGRLPNLKMLLLGYHSYKWTKLVCSSSEGFPQLHILHLQLLNDLEELIVEEGAIMKLKNLKIVRCPRLRKIPKRFKLLTILLNEGDLY